MLHNILYLIKPLIAVPVRKCNLNKKNIQNPVLSILKKLVILISYVILILDIVE